MTRFAALLVLASVAAAEPAKPATHQVQLDGQTFTLPVGFTIERVAGPPLVDRPIVASFDDRGRLYVADSSGSNEKVAEQVKNPTHRIIRLEDTKGTGVFDKATVFADKMMFPEGILWYRGSVYVGAPPQIWKLTDTDDDGKADKREVWFDGKTLTGCANDLHGPYLGPDGWIYWCKGAFAKQEYTLPNGKKFATRASHIFRARPDGTGIEPVMTGGMDNPVGLAFLPNGERFFTCTFLQHPAAGKRDGIIHAVYGGIWGKDHDVIYDPDHKWTSPNTMPVMTHLGPAAPCGLHCYESDAFGKEYTSNLFACQFNLRKVSRHVLKPSGSTYTTEDSDFLVSDSQDFHPTDVVEDADGSLLVVNTGGWYKLCCPSSQLVKADVLGAIYRVRRAPAKYEYKWFPSDAALARISDRELTSRYYSPIPQIVRERVGELLVERLGAIGKPTQAPIPMQKAEELAPPLVIDIWTMCQKEGDAARASNRTYFHHGSDSVVMAAVHAASLWRDREAVPELIRLLSHGKPHVRRVAAEALGRIGDDRAVEPLLKELAFQTNDHILDHALTYALIELENRDYLKSKLDSENPRVRRACLAALDQLGEKLDPKVVAAAMKSPDPALSETALWIATRHPEWGAALTDGLRQMMAAAKTSEARDQAADRLARLARHESVQRLLADAVASLRFQAPPPIAETDPVALVALAAMARSGLKAPPDSWYGVIAVALTGTDSKVTLAALSTLRALPAPKKVPEALSERLESLSFGVGKRDVILAAMAATPGGLRRVDRAQFEVLVSCIHKDMFADLRGLASEAVSKARLTPEQLDALITKLPTVGPLELDRVLAAFAQTKDEAVGLKLIAALNNPDLRSSLRADGVKERIKHFGPAVQKEAEKLYALLNAEYEQQRAKLDEVAKTLKPGDIRRGQAVFNSTKTSCIACHTIGYVGGKIGPDLTRIGGIRNERDLLESILFPSASFVRSYEPLTVRTKDGKVFNGIPKKDAPDEIVLVLAADKEQRIAREEIEEVQPGKVSIMPAGLDKQLSEQELADLIAFLRACK
jgi:putative membrane-bound dehydrogenase-like protein